ncbi:MAG: serine acetyltransferase [Bacteroidales bacterium]|nr:serine acetyltransferase [Bacteroidales bacterium]
MIVRKHTSIIEQSIRKLTEGENARSVCVYSRNAKLLISQGDLKIIIDLARSILFPGYFSSSHITTQTAMNQIGKHIERLYELLSGQICAGLCFHTVEADYGECWDKAQELATRFISGMPDLRRMLETDVVATYNGDPAAESYGEVIYCYPAIRAISNYRIAHELLLLGVPIIPRMITEMAHSETGIDIHPAAKIGKAFTIDHGTGVVIGATAIIGNQVKLYQGVTLGAKSFPLDANGNPIKGIPRHPIIEDDVIIYSNATILGRITIGKGAIIGGNLWVTEDVPPEGRVVQMKAKR